MRILREVDVEHSLDDDVKNGGCASEFGPALHGVVWKPTASNEKRDDHEQLDCDSLPADDFSISKLNPA